MPLCPHRPPCPGCPRFGERGLPADAYRALRALAVDAGLPPPSVVEGAPFGWRHRARLAVRGRSASPKVGIFQEDSHRIVDIPQCLVHHPVINAVAAAVKTAVRATGIAPYADAPHAGVLRYVQVVVERRTQQAQVVLIANGTAPAACAPLAEQVAAVLGERLHSLWWNGNPARTNAILGSLWHRWSGPEAMHETIGGADVFFPPAAFGQANLDLADRMAAEIAAWVPDDASIVELYAGCGALGLGLLARATRVAFNEMTPGGLAGLALGVAARAPIERERAEILPGPAADHAGRIGEADVVIVDPPRKGLDTAVLEALASTPPARLIVVSCNLDAFLAEARVLRASGRMALVGLVPFALFPHTAHVETVALFARRPGLSARAAVGPA